MKAIGMKPFALRYSFCLLVQSVVICGVVRWRSEIYSGNPIGVLLAWPAVWLASFGLSHTWPIALLMLLAVPAISVHLLRKRRVVFGAVTTALLTLAFCWTGAWWAGQTENTRPSMNPYPAGSREAAAYSEGYGLGFGNAVTGSLATYCFRPEDATRGYYQGQEEGMTIWNRTFGLQEDKGRWLIRRSAERDGVRPAVPDR